MLCRYYQCVDSTIHKTCRCSKNPETCAYGEYVKELKTAYQNGLSFCLNNTSLITIVGHRIKELIRRILKRMRFF